MLKSEYKSSKKLSFSFFPFTSELLKIQVWFNEFNFEQDNLYCYNEFIFTTNKNINNIEIEYVD